MCKRDRIRHIFFRFVCRITEHHTLISGTDRFDLIIRHFIFFCFKCLIYTHCNICRLFINCRNYAARICVKSIFSSRISDLTYRITHNLLNINVSLRCNLAHYKDKTCRCRRLTCNAAHRILLHQRIKDRI